MSQGSVLLFESCSCCLCPNNAIASNSLLLNGPAFSRGKMHSIRLVISCASQARHATSLRALRSQCFILFKRLTGVAYDSTSFSVICTCSDLVFLDNQTANYGNQNHFSTTGSFCLFRTMPVLHRWNDDDDEKVAPIARPSSGGAWRYDETESEGEESEGSSQPLDHKSLFRSSKTLLNFVDLTRI